MLPSSGYFRGIACPAHTRGSCNRPYCHFRHDMKGFPERNVSSSSSLSSSPTAMPTPSKEDANAEEDGKQEDLQYQDSPKDVTECSSTTLSTATAASSGSGEQLQPQPHTSQQQESVTATDDMPKSELLHQLMSEALKKVLAENPILASTVDASAIRIGIDPITHKSPEVNKTKKQFYLRPPDTPSYNPTPIKELKKRKLSVDGVNSLGYSPSGTKFTNVTEAKRNVEEDEGDVIGEFSSDDSEEEEEKNDDFDLLEEVLAEHSKNNKVKVKKKRVKELGKLQYHLSNADKKIVDCTVMIADAKKQMDKEVKTNEVPQPESVNKVITDGPYFLPPSPVFTSSSDGFEAFNSRASYQEEEEENSMPEKCSDKPLPHMESTKTNSHPASVKETMPKQTPDPTKSGSEPVSEKKAPKASGHTHLPQLLSDAPKLSRPNVRNWIPLVRNSIPVPDVQKNKDQLEEILQLMDGSSSSSKRKMKECENQVLNQRDSESARPRKKYKVDLNKEIESLTNPLIDQMKETITRDKDSATHQPVASNAQENGKKQSTQEPSAPEESCLEPKEKQVIEEISTQDSGEKKAHGDEAEREDKKKTHEGDSETESDDSDSNSHDEESEDDSKHRRARHKKKRKRGRSSSSDSDHSRHRRKKRKRGQKHRHKRNKKSRKRRDSTSSLSDQSKASEEEKEEEEEEEEESDDEEEGNEKGDEEEEKENKNKVDSESEDKEDSDEVEHKKSRRHKKKHKYYKKSKHKRTKHKSKRKRKRSKSYSRSRSSSGSRDSSRSRSRSRSSSKHRKKKSQSRHRSRNLSDGEERDSNKDRRSSSRNSCSYKKSRESREKDSVVDKHVESRKSRDKSLDKEGRKDNKEDRKSRDRSTSKSRQQSVDEDGNNKKNGHEDVSIPMPVDPSKIKVEKNALIPDLSKVKIEKEDSVSERSDTQDNATVNKKDNDKSQEEKSKGKGESGLSKAAEKVHERRRSSTEEKSRRRRSHERKNSTESTSDKVTPRQQGCESKFSDGEVSQQRKKVEEKRRSSTDKSKKTLLISSQPSEMSMFDLVLANTEKPKLKTLTEISIFDSLSNTNTVYSESEEASGDKVAQHDTKKSKNTSHKPRESSIKCPDLVNSEQESSSDNKTNKSSRSEKPARTDSHHKHDKSESKSSHSSSKSKSSSSSHHSSSSSSSNSSSHKRTTSTSSKGSSSGKHHNTTATTTTLTNSTIMSSSSSTKNSESSSSSSSKSKKASDPSSNKGEKDSTRHSSISGRKHSSISNKLMDSSSNSRRRSSSSSSKHKEDKDSFVEPTKTSEGSEATRKRKISVEEDSPGGISDDDHFSSAAGDSPLPDLSVLDEIPQDDWEQMLSGSDTFSAVQEPLEDCDDMDHDDPKVLEECMKLFSEFQQDSNPLENQVLPKKIKVSSEDKEPAAASNKQRVARSSSTGNLIIKKPSGSRHQRNNPMQRMVERYQKLKEQLKLKEKQLHHLQGGSSAVSSTSSSRTSIAAASSSTHHNPPSQSTSGKTKKRIAHVPNVSSLLHAREKIFNRSPSVSRAKLSPRVASAGGVIPETTAHTVAKGGKRIAHTPRAGALARPIIQPEFGSLVPQNIRQRYLNALIEECKKFCSEKEAFNIAAAEERVCYQRAPSRMVYLNLVVNAVKRLRTQKEAGEAAQELLDEDPQLAEKMCIEEPSSSSNKPSSSPSPSSPTSSRSHPVNPNHVQLSHTTVLSSGGLRGSWSIEKPKKTANSSEEVLKGETFYKHLLKYVLTEEQLEENGYPYPDPEEKGKAVVKKVDSRKKISPSALERFCDRCSVLYTVDKWGFPKSSAPCVHHWGRPYKKRKYGTFETTYSCCGGEQGSEGCNQATTHVSQNYNPKSLRGYVRTISKDTSISNKEVYALDCEMCYTTEGNELTRVTVIGCSGDVVYEQLVKPENPILDYNTRFSGITESDMEDVKLTIRDVQAALLARFSDKTILIGHSLESDLHALKIIHTTVVDTSVVFPHKMGAPYKRALKNLAAEYLKRIIQDNVAGHDSAEDAVACLHLMQWKVKEDLKGFSK